MPAAHTTEETTGPDYSMLDADSLISKPRTSSQTAVPVNTPSERRPPTGPPHRRDSQDVKPHNSEREPKKLQGNREFPDTHPAVIASSTSTSATTTKKTPSSDRNDDRSGFSSHPETTSDSDSSDDFEKIVPPGNLKERELSGPMPSTIDPKPTRIALSSQPPASYAQVTVTGRSSKDPQDSPPGTTEDGTPRIASQRPPNAQAPPGHFPENEQREMLEIRQLPPGQAQAANYGQGGVMGALMSFIPTANPPPPKDKYQTLKEDYRRLQRDMKQVCSDLEAHKHEVRRCHGEMRHAKHYINQLHHEKQQFTDHMGSLQNELTNVHQQLGDAKTLSEVRGKELFGAQVFLTKADTLSISEVSEKVTALNEEIFQAAATLGEALIHHRHELSQEDLDAVTACSRGMVGEKITNLLISQAQKPEPEVNPLLVQVVLQIFMVTFCVSKIQSWYPSDSAIGEFLNAIYTTIRSSEEQAVSGRWRALTRAHTRPSTDTWTDELSQKLMAVLKTAAWMPSSPENQDSFGNRLPPIFKAVNELRLAIGEKFTSADLDISVFDSGTLYEPAYMEDAYGDGRQPSGKRTLEIVVGTTGIGLKKLMAERDANDNLMFQSVTSAKIVLESTLKEALKPVQASGRLTKKKKAIENTDGADPESRGSSKPKTSFMGI